MSGTDNYMGLWAGRCIWAHIFTAIVVAVSLSTYNENALFSLLDIELFPESLLL